MGTERKPRAPNLDHEMLRKMIVDDKLSDAEIARRLGCHKNSVANIRRDKLKLGLVGKGGYQTKAIKPKPPSTFTLSPAMRHLAKFDSVIRLRLEREEGVPIQPGINGRPPGPVGRYEQRKGEGQ